MFGINSNETLLVLISAAASIATCMAAIFSFLAIRQVRVLNQKRENSDKKRLTVKMVGDGDNSIPLLSREPMEKRKMMYPFTCWSRSQLEKKLRLPAQGLSPRTIEKIHFSLNRRVPYSYDQSIPRTAVEELNHLLFAKPFELDSEIHKTYAALFNKLEDIANAVNNDLIELNLIDFMYGGMLSNIYRNHSEWLSFIKRRLGARTYDQLDLIIDGILSISGIQYTFRRMGLLLHLIFSDSKKKRALAWKVLFNPSRWRKPLSRNAFCRILISNGLQEDIDVLTNLARLPSIDISYVQKIKKVQSNRSFLRSLFRLFNDCWQKSEGVWPVGMQEYTADRQKLEKLMFKRWLVHFVESVDYYITAKKKKLFWRSDVVGFIAISTSNSVKKQEKRWNGEILSAIKNTGRKNTSKVEEYLFHMGIPYMQKEGVICLNFSKIAMLKAFYVHSKYRNAESYEPVGRKMLRKSLSFCRYELGVVPILTVLADSKFTEKAIELYVGEGGAYLGTTRDAGKAENHLMHVFVF